MSVAKNIARDNKRRTVILSGPAGSHTIAAQKGHVHYDMSSFVSDQFDTVHLDAAQTKLIASYLLTHMSETDKQDVLNEVAAARLEQVSFRVLPDLEVPDLEESSPEADDSSEQTSYVCELA